MTMKKSNLFSFAISTKVIGENNADDESFRSKMWRDGKTKHERFWKWKSGSEVLTKIMDVSQARHVISSHTEWN